MPIKRFLVVDDVSDNLSTVKGVLSELRISDALAQENSQSGLDLVEPKRIECVITSWDTKKMPGRIFIQKLRKVPANQYLPLIIYSQRLKPEDVRLINELGEVSVLAAPIDRKALSDTIKKIIEKDAGLSEMERSIRVAVGHYGMKQYDEAIKVAEGLLAKGGDIAECHVLVASCALEKNDYEKTELHLNSALKLKPNLTSALQLRARLLAKSGKHQDAIDSLVKLLDQSPQVLTTLNYLGQTYKAAERLQEAKDIFNNLMEHDPNSREAKDGLGEVAFMEGQYDVAMEMLKDTSNAEEIARNLNNLGIALTARQDYTKAIQGYINAIRIINNKQTTHLLYYNLGLAYSKSGDHKAAFDVFAQSCLLSPQYVKAYAAFIRTVKELAKMNTPYDKSVVEKVKAAVKPKI
jgi:tetratricopeptide (TPR) repeat protein